MIEIFNICSMYDYIASNFVYKQKNIFKEDLIMSKKNHEGKKINKSQDKKKNTKELECKKIVPEVESIPVTSLQWNRTSPF